jgi:glycosyltransferase involved in cell wall biosynthesis
MKLIIHNGAKVWGGNEKSTLLLAEALAARGHDVRVSCRRGGEVARRVEARGVPVAHARPGRGADLPRGVRFAAWLARERPDAVLLTSWRCGGWGAWATRRACPARVVVRLGIVRTPSRWSEALPFRRWVDRMIVNAPEIAEAWAREAPWFPAARIHMVLNGIRPDPVDRAAAAASLRAELGVGAGTLLVGAAGIVSHRKGFDVLLDAFARAALPDARVVLAGDGPELAALRRRAAERGIADRVHWLGHRDDVPRVLAGCGVFVLPSRNEGMANVMLEAMAGGTPVIASDVSGVRTALAADVDGGDPAGWIVPAGDPDALAVALRDFDHLWRDQPALVHARGEQALRRIRGRFGIDRMAAESEAVLFG